MPAALLKRYTSKGVFPWILRDFLEHLFCIWLSKAKLMWTAASGVSENRPCLAGCKCFVVFQNWL